MSHEEALAALRTGDFEKAASLLGPLVEQNRFGSDALNHAYTVALHKINSPRLPDVSFQIAQERGASNPGTAADYYQRAILTGLGQDRVQMILDWQGSLAERGLQKSRNEIRSDRIGHVIGCFLPGHAPSLYIQLLAKSLKGLGVESHVFTTE
jgi:hypothetical protein